MDGGGLTVWVDQLWLLRREDVRTSPDAGGLGRGLRLSTSDLGLSTSDLGFPTSDLRLSTSDLGFQCGRAGVCSVSSLTRAPCVF